MANALYDKGREGFLAGDIDWDLNNIRVILVDTGVYIANLATDIHQTNIGVTARIATSGVFATKTVTAGVADASDVTLSAVTGATSEALVIFQDTGASATSRLIAYIDTASGLPVIPNGGDIEIQWDNASNKIFKL